MSQFTPRHLLSERSLAVNASGIRKVFDLAAKMPDPINLSIGQPDFDVPESIRRAAIEAIQSRRNGYTITQGIPQLREKLAAEVKADSGQNLPVLVTSGVSGGILLALMATLNPGDEVLIGDPYFVIYKHAVRLVGGTPVFVDTYPDFGFDPARYEAAVTSRTKVLVIASPSNPTGVVLSEQALRQAAELVERHNLLLIVDEIYSRLCFDGPCPSAIQFSPDRTLLLRGFGKSYGMTGWRLGYAAGPQFLIEEMTKLQQYTFVCAPSIVQYAGVVAMDTDMTAYADEYRKKRDYVHERLAGSFEVTRPGGGFYFFPRVPAHYANDMDFVEKAIEQNVLIIPGSVFSEKDTHFRISYATSDDKLARGCDILCDLAGGRG
ncbi:MAG TPA: aminotransferase class I/II-fold pyridoxal phosphate-dependent enzyme [Phycisphaerae bacterium]|nr:aminotransferase class I/II-fold pyridoxal phosphate-dependent enzyme [Phycisphaerae bacterium]